MVSARDSSAEFIGMGPDLSYDLLLVFISYLDTLLLCL